MTAHEALSRRKRAVMGLMSGAIALHSAGVVIGVVADQPFAVIVILPAFFLALIGAVWGYCRGCQCPWCRGNLTPLVYGRGAFSFDRRFLFCPYCAHRLDEEMPEAEFVGTGDRT